MGRSEHDRRIGEMFDRVAPRYDFLNRALSAGRDAGWRRRAIALAALGRGETALDVGVGTGDLALALLAGSDPSARVVGVDLSEEMLVRARARAVAAGVAERFVAEVASVHQLPYGDASFDRVVAGFAVRNFGDLAAGLREMRRVLRPGGRAVILELSTPPNPVVRGMFDLYFHRLSPRLAALLGGDRDAYRYLPLSVRRFPRAERLADILSAAGFGRVRFERLTLGIAAIHVAEP